MGQARYYKTLQLPQLRSFCLAATQGNFSATARALNLSVATVWQQVRSLEKQVEASLLRRRGRSLELTEEGRLLLELIQPHISGLDSLLPLFKARRAELDQPLSIASTRYLISYHLPPPVRDFSKLFPSVRLQLLSGPSIDMLRIVERGEVHLGVLSYDREEPRNPALEYEDLFELQLTLLTSQEHPLSRQRRLSLHDLVKHPLILPSPASYSYKVLERLLLRENLLKHIHVVMQNDSTDSILKYVALGVGIALLYTRREVSRLVPQVHFRVFDPKLPALPVAFVTPKGAHLPGPVTAFQRLLHRSMLDHGSSRLH